MSKYTAEQIEEMARALRKAPATSMLGTHISLPTAKAVAMYEALCDYATLLRECESAKAAVTEEMVEVAVNAHAEWFGGHRGMRAALEAVAPMAASARVPDEKEDLDPVRLHREGRVATEWERGFNEGWNDCREAMLAAAPKPETEE